MWKARISGLDHGKAIGDGNKKIKIDLSDFRLQCRNSCGSDHVIENLLPYLLPPDFVRSHDYRDDEEEDEDSDNDDEVEDNAGEEDVVEDVVVDEEEDDENDEDVSPSMDVQRLPMLRCQGLVP
jgi:hypothetical protein